MLLLILCVGAAILTHGATAQSTTSTTTRIPSVPTTTKTGSTAVQRSTGLRTTTSTTPSTSSFQTSARGPVPDTNTTTTPQSTSASSQTYPVRAGLRALVRSTVELDINLANSILQQYLSNLPSYYNVTARIISIKKI